jgi:diacylglycerol diphosphate phosphatase/phosphatidate phosphatase
MNFVYALFIPLAVLVAYNFITRAPTNQHEVTYLPFLISLFFTSFVTDIIKDAVGRPRPDMLDRCQPAADTPRDTLVTIAVCTAPDSPSLQDGWRSFPSGHSSFSFAGLGFFSLFFAGQLHVLHAGSYGSRDFGRVLVCFVPLMGALMIAISRCEDYRHDVYDVSVGGVLGMSIAYWSYRRHWPRLSSPNCHEPLPRPDAESDNPLATAVDNDPHLGWRRVGDEEEAEGRGIVGDLEMD